MCGTCGCSAQNKVQIQTIEPINEINSAPTHNEKQEISSPSKLQHVEAQILSHNNHIAQHNRDTFNAKHIIALNLVSSPGAGKTTLLESTLTEINRRVPCTVIEGDQQTANDAARIAATGVNAIQINTGTGCHLEADMIHQVMHHHEIENNSYLFIENVGNLVCPALFDLGELCKVAILSVTEGEDKPLKYPHMFQAAQLMIINKVDLLPYVQFDVKQCIDYAKQVNPDIEVIEVSATSKLGLDDWLSWLERLQPINNQEVRDGCAHHHHHA